MEQSREISGGSSVTGKRKWYPFLLIVAASALAHLWCLGSQFYMDDHTGIVDNPVVRDGGFWRYISLSWTYLGYFIQFKLFGMNPVGFHAVNWLLHTAVACTLFLLARDLLENRGSQGVALFAALLFAVHPLASEIPNYARTQDLAWVTLFSLLATWFLIRFLRDGSRKQLVGAALAVAGATLSKGPGLFHALMMAGVVGLAYMRLPHWQLLRRRIWWIAGVVALAVGILWIVGFLPKLVASTHQWGEPRFIGHAFTLARVFWEFAWRAVVPVSLCSDHQIAETVVPQGAGWFGIPDKIAVVSAIGMLGLAVAAGLLAWRKSPRVFGVCLLLFVGTILFRVTYLIPEFMPEYRIYPGMPWFCLGASVLLAGIWGRIPGGGSPRWLAALILLPLVVLSARRSFVWHDLDRLCANVLEQYPAQARAVWELHDRDIARGAWQKVIDRQERVWPRVFRSFVDQSKKLAPVRDLNSGNFALADIACEGRYAIALAHLRGPAAGVAAIRRLEAKMKALHITPDTNRTICGYFHHARATVMEMAGAYQPALESMRFKGVFKFRDADIERVERKLAEQRR